jgi:hypothetical protein
MNSVPPSKAQCVLAGYKTEHLWLDLFMVNKLDAHPSFYDIPPVWTLATIIG